MNRSNRIIATLLLLHTLGAVQLERATSLGRVPENSPSVQLLSALYLSSEMLPPSQESLMTYADLRETLQWWRGHSSPTAEQLKIVERLQAIIGSAPSLETSASPRFYLNAGLDFLHKPSFTGADSLNGYYLNFKDRDFLTKYSRRGSFAEFGLTTYLGRNIFLSAAYSGRDDWEHLLKRDYHYPRNFRDFNFDINRRVYLVFQHNAMKLLLGRDTVQLGIGEHGRLILSDNLPPLDQIRFFYHIRDIISFNSIIAPVKFYSEPGVPEKILAVHRLEWSPGSRVKIGLTEGMVTNQRIRAAYLNPFMVFHNVSDYALKRNMMGALDIRILWPHSLITYMTFLIDELDVNFLEKVEKGKNRQALGIQAGLKYLNPFGLKDTHFLAEFVHLDKWLYNYPYADGTLTYVYEEERFYQGQFIFNRFIGHYLGSNADALYLDFHTAGFTFSIQAINQGFVPIDQPAFTPVTVDIIEKKRILGVRYDGVLQLKKFSVSTGFFYTVTRNFHNILGRNESYPEIWVNLQHQLINW